MVKDSVTSPNALIDTHESRLNERKDCTCGEDDDAKEVVCCYNQYLVPRPRVQAVPNFPEQPRYCRTPSKVPKQFLPILLPLLEVPMTHAPVHAKSLPVKRKNHCQTVPQLQQTKYSFLRASRSAKIQQRFRFRELTIPVSAVRCCDWKKTASFPEHCGQARFERGSCKSNNRVSEVLSA